jgi:hypothetical protein
MSNDGAKTSSQTDGEKALTEVLGAVSKLTSGMEKLFERIGALEARFDGNRRVTMARGGGKAEEISSVTAHRSDGAPAEQFQDGQSFFDKSPDQENGRYSYGSLGSNFGFKDPGTKLERPKFVVKQVKVKDGAKTENVQFSDYLDFFDEYEQYMDAWETIPANFIDGVPQNYPNRERVAVLNIPFKYAHQLSDRLQLLYDRNDLQHMSLAEIQAATYWKDMSTREVRRRIGLKFAAEVSVKGSLDILRRIEFKSLFGLIDVIAFSTYKHELKREIQRLQAGENFVVNKIQIKDIVIAALPDKLYQQELHAKYGNVGSLLMASDEFSLSMLFNEVDARIESITKQGLRAIVNKSTRERDSKFTSYNKPSVAHVVHQGVPADGGEWLEMIQDQVNAALVGNKQCRSVGVGSDKLLKCRFLGGTKATCTFEHPPSDLALKGKGVTKDVPSPQWLNTGRKVHNMSAALNFDFPESDEDFWRASDSLPSFPDTPPEIHDTEEE